MRRHFLIVTLISCAVVTAYSYQNSKPWPPGLQQVSDESPVLSPEDEMKTFFMPPGYHVELVASEPLIEEPILIDWDADGRMWVIEARAYMQDLPATNERDPIGRISVLEDTNNDGKMDKKTVFLDGLVLPRALKVLDHGVLIGEPPHLWLARDTNGDLKADTRELVVDTYGQELGNIEHNANSLTWAMDNWMYTSEHNGYLRLKDGKFDYQPTLSRGQWGATQDDAGRIYRNTNEAALFVDLLPARYFTRNPNLVRTRGCYESLQNDEVNTVWPVRPTRGVNRGYQDGILRPDGRLAHFTSVCSPTVYRGDRLPAELYGNVFVAEPAANLVSRIIVSDDGTTLRAKKAYRGRRVSRVDRRTIPAGLFIVGTRRHVVCGRHLPRDHSTQGLHHRVPPRSNSFEETRSSEWSWAYLSHRPRQHQARQGPGFVEGHTGATGRHAVAPERVVAGHRAASTCRAGRSVRHQGAGRQGGERTRLAHADACPVDARRSRCDRRVDGDACPGRFVSRRASCRAPTFRAMARSTQSANPSRSFEAHRGHGLGGPPPARSDAGDVSAEFHR